MSHGSGSRELGHIPRLVQRAWHQKRGRVVLLAALSFVILLLWSMASSVRPAVLLFLAIHLTRLQQTSDVLAITTTWGVTGTALALTRLTA